ncbi:flavodoxin family protein [Nocardioides daeguensis]|uniref:Flavodoxin family protein n=1 Tax=Nocardioides daeguensis TaxID=908359 RepID=A0ABP6VL24_9ACTN|nr:flavodoxin family protein [Nocardioides daeguensis]MBV6727461.1 flavodoxin family protein [Nocardioides daeguensis]MCR1773317.1 flavodoxin family protein [Nocardioides daeguensis]
MPRLLIVHHSPTRSMRALLKQVVAGAHDEDVQATAAVEVVVRPALEATADDVSTADGYVLGTTANFGYMSGALKHFFDSTFLAVGGALDPTGAPADGAGATAGRPYGLWLHGRYDLTGAERSVHSIVGALGWRQGYDVLGVLGDVDDTALAAAYALGATIAALLAD